MKTLTKLSQLWEKCGSFTCVFKCIQLVVLALDQTLIFFPSKVKFTGLMIWQFFIYIRKTYSVSLNLKKNLNVCMQTAIFPRTDRQIWRLNTVWYVMEYSWIHNLSSSSRLNSHLYGFNSTFFSVALGLYLLA